MLPLLQAIHARFLSDSRTTSALPGGLWPELAAEGTAMPYVVYQIIAAPTTSVYGGAKLNQPRIRFVAYVAGSADVALTAMKAFTDVFDDAVLLLLPVGSGVNFDARRDSDPQAVISPKRDAAGNDVWRAVTEYVYCTR